MYTFSSKIILYTKKAYIFLFIAVGSLLFLLPTSSVRGESHPGGVTGNGDGGVIGNGDGGVTGPGSGITVELENPLTVKTLNEFIKAILDIVLTIGIPIVALAIIYSGFLFVTAGGDPERLKKAKDTFLWVIIGAAILLGAWVLAQAIGSTIEEIRSVV